MKKQLFLTMSLLLLDVGGGQALAAGTGDDDYNTGDTYNYGGRDYTISGSNLFSNGGFEDSVTGWKANFYSQDADISNFSYSESGGYNGGAYITVTSGAGAESVYTPCQAIEVETGAMYLFVGYTKGTKPADSNLRYNGLLEMSSATTEVLQSGTTGHDAVVVAQLKWGDGTEWTKTEQVFIASTDYVGARFTWCNGASFDGMQLYKIEDTSSETLSSDDEYKANDTYVDGNTTYTVKSGNLVTNGGFEDSSLSGWVGSSYTSTTTVTGAIHNTTGGFNNGAYVTLNSSGADNGATPHQAISVEEGKIYLFIGYTSGTTVTDANKAYNCLFKLTDNHTEDGYWTQLNWGVEAGVMTTSWTKTEYVFTAESSHPYVGIRLGWSGANYDGFQLYEVEAVAPEDASPGNPVDLTSLISNPNAYDYSYNGWTCSNNVNGITRKNGQHWDGTDASYFEPNDWDYTLWEEDIYQNITLPYDGVYKLTAAGRSSDEARTTLFAGDVEHVFPALGATGGTIATDGTTCEVGTEGYTFANDGAGYGWTWGSVEVVAASAGKLTIGAKFQSFTADTHQWASIVNFKLEYLGSADDTKIGAVKEDLSEYIDYAETIDTETNVGSGAFQRPQTAVDALTSAITTAKSALEASSATEASLLSALSALEKAVDDFENATLNTPATDQTFAIVMKEEFEKDNVQYYDKAVVFNFTNESSGCCFFDEEWNRNYASENFTFTPDNSKTNGYIISTVTENETTYYLKLNTDNLGIRATESEDEAFVFQVVATETEGIWHLYNSASHMNVGSNGDRGFYTDNAHTNLYLASNEIPVNITTAGWTTLVLPYDADLPSGSDLTAYTIEGKSETQENAVTLTEVEDGKLKAKTPYLISGTDVAEYAINGTSTVFDINTAPSDSYLVGTWTDISSVTPGNYLLQYQPDAKGTAFYIVNSDSISLAANRCYLNGTSVGTANAPYFSLSMGDDVATAIESALEAAQSEGNGAVYDLSGRKVSKAQKGIYIKDGKKVIIK